MRGCDRGTAPAGAEARRGCIRRDPERGASSQRKSCEYRTRRNRPSADRARGNRAVAYRISDWARFPGIRRKPSGYSAVLTIPSTAILRAPFGDSVFVISGSTNLTVQQKFIRTGRTLGYFVSVESGLKAGDRVVEAGVFKLRNGMSVVENNETTPKTSQTPNPPNG